MVQEAYLRWLQYSTMEEDLKEQLRVMSEEEITDCFYTDIAFGTAGMRGKMGPGPNRINSYTIMKATIGFAKYLVESKQLSQEKGIVIGYDNRHHSKDFALESAKVLASYNIPTYIFDTLCPTPEVSFTVRDLNCVGGIMITASHNPKEYNGYKLYDETGCQLIPEKVEKVINFVNEVQDVLSLDIKVTPQQEELIHMIGDEIHARYDQHVFDIQLRPEMDKGNVKIVFTPQHGTASRPVQAILKRAGYHVIVVEEQAFEDPDFINTVSPNPEERSSYDLAITYGEKYQADIILTCDPDADRMGVAMLVDGEYIVLNGDQTGALLMQYIFYTRKELNMMPNNPVMFNTIVTSDLGEQVAKAFGVECEKTLTGFKYIGSKIAHYEKTKEKEYVFGYEESYGSLIMPFVRDKDAPQACLMLCEAASYYKHQNQSFHDVLNMMYDQYGAYVEHQTSIVLEGKDGAEKMQQLLTSLREEKIDTIAFTSVNLKEDYLKQIREGKGGSSSIVGFDQSDVLKYYLADGSWIAIRPSGTEPKCKIYYSIKDKTRALAKQKLDVYVEAMQLLMK